MIIDCIGCTHGAYPELSGGDLLIVTGDITAHDKMPEWVGFFKWLKKQDYKKKILIGGNHDRLLEQCISTAEAKAMGFHELDDITSHYLYDDSYEYLYNNGTEFEGLKIWGSPHSVWFHGVNPLCKAFMEKESQLAKRWALIPLDVDILITHTPPYLILDDMPEHLNFGSHSLLVELETRLKPKLHVFSHIHEGYGQLVFKRPGHGSENNTLCVNCSIMDENYKPVNKPIRVEL